MLCCDLVVVKSEIEKSLPQFRKLPLLLGKRMDLLGFGSQSCYDNNQQRILPLFKSGTYIKHQTRDITDHAYSDSLSIEIFLTRN